MLWLSFAAFVLCLFHWCREWNREEIRRAEPEVPQTVEIHRTKPDAIHLFITDSDEELPPRAAPLSPEFSSNLSHDEDLKLESIIGASSLSLDVNGLTLEAWGFFAPDAPAMRQAPSGNALQAELSAELAEAVAEREGLLRLDHLTSLTPEAASALATHTGELTLNGLTELLPEVAKALANHKGFLQLNGLTTLTRDAAEALAQSKSLLRLNGLATLSPEAAEALAKYDGLLILSGLRMLSPEAVAALRANPAMKLPEQFKKQMAGAPSGMAVDEMQSTAWQSRQ